MLIILVNIRWISDNMTLANPEALFLQPDHKLILCPTMPNDVPLTDMGILLNKLGRQDDAAQLLSKAEAPARGAFSGSNAFRLGSLLSELGESRRRQDAFEAAELNLLEAQVLLSQGLGDDHARTVATVERLVLLYDTWNTAEPNAGLGENAADWRAKLFARDTHSED